MHVAVPISVTFTQDLYLATSFQSVTNIFFLLICSEVKGYQA